MGLFLIVSVDNIREAALNVYGYSTPFVSASTRRQFEAAFFGGAFDVQPDSIADTVFAFVPLEVEDLTDGGRLVVSVADSKTYDTWEIELAIPPLTG